MKKDAAMQRVRIGLTGLSCVFLLVLLAAAFLGFVGDRPVEQGTPAANSARTAPADRNSAADAPKEPLAELGVAPGNAPEENQTR